MADKTSRRDLLKAGLVGAAGLALGGVAKAAPADDVLGVEKGLAEPLSPKARELTKASLKGNQDASAARLKTKLPENSEPCFVFHPTPVEKKR